MHTKKIFLSSSLSMCVVAILTIVSAVLSPSTITIAAAVTAPICAVITTATFVVFTRKHADA